MNWQSFKHIALIGIIIVVVPIIILIFFRKNIFNFILKPEQKKIISSLHASVQEKFSEFISEVEKQTEYNVIIIQGYKSWADQQKLYDKNPKNPKPGDTLYNYGLTIDINAANDTSYIRGKSSKKKWDKSKIVEIANKIGIKQNPDRLSNFYIGDYNIPQLKNISIAQFGTNPADVKGNEIKLSALPSHTLRKLNA